VSEHWRALDRELDLWDEAGRTAAWWWRDDDAAAATPALDRLLAMKGALPLTLAVIPARLEPSLPARLGGVPGVRIAVHGWAHANHAPADMKKAEFGLDRPLAERRDDAARGREALVAAFGPAAGALFVPPWNRIADDMAPVLAGLGFTALSAFAPRKTLAPAGLRIVDTHVDPIAWRDRGGFAGEAPALDTLVRHLAAQREGRAPAGPVGLLTHHLVHDEATWAFIRRLTATLATHGAARAVDPLDGAVNDLSRNVPPS
jgi:hypothetical protein